MRFCVCVRNFHTIIIYPIRAIPFHTFLLYDLSLIVVSELKTILRSQESTFLFINDLSRHPTIFHQSYKTAAGLRQSRRSGDARNGWHAVFDR